MRGAQRAGPWGVRALSHCPQISVPLFPSPPSAAAGAVLSSHGVRCGRLITAKRRAKGATHGHACITAGNTDTRSRGVLEMFFELPLVVIEDEQRVPIFGEFEHLPEVAVDLRRNVRNTLDRDDYVFRRQR